MSDTARACPKSQHFTLYRAIWRTIGQSLTVLWSPGVGLSVRKKAPWRAIFIWRFHRQFEIWPSKSAQALWYDLVSLLRRLRFKIPVPQDLSLIRRSTLYTLVYAWVCVHRSCVTVLTLMLPMRVKGPFIVRRQTIGRPSSDHYRSKFTQIQLSAILRTMVGQQLYYKFAEQDKVYGRA